MYIVDQNWAFKVLADDVLRLFLRTEACKSYSGNARQLHSLFSLKSNALIRFSCYLQFQKIKTSRKIRQKKCALFVGDAKDHNCANTLRVVESASPYTSYSIKLQ